MAGRTEQNQEPRCTHWQSPKSSCFWQQVLVLKPQSELSARTEAVDKLQAGYAWWGADCSLTKLPSCPTGQTAS